MYIKYVGGNYLMRAVIVEDEKPILELMKIVIGGNRYVDIIGSFTSPKEAMDKIPELSPDVIFMDIEMPCVNGMELAKQVKTFNDNIQIVFVTAYEKYALEAFQVDAVNYILKPITEEDLNVTVNRLLKNINIEKEISEQDKRNEIFSFGCFKVYGNSGSEIIKWSTSKVQELFAYFVCKRGEETDKWTLCDILWPNALPKRAEHNLHSTIYRMKNVFKNAGIDNVVYYQNGKYRMDLSQFKCDQWEFESFIENNPLVNDENITYYEKIAGLYKGTLFENQDYIWDVELNQKFSRYYLYIMKNIAKYFIDKKNYNRAEEYLKKTIDKNPFDEEANELLMKVYSYMGDKVELVKCYKELARLFKKELHISLKNSTKRLYKNLLAGL